MSNCACGDRCPVPDWPHREPEPFWIGNAAILHGESDYELPVPYVGFFTPLPDMYCLCGHPNYLTCPGYLFEEDDLGGLTISLAERTSRGGAGSGHGSAAEALEDEA